MAALIISTSYPLRCTKRFIVCVAPNPSSAGVSTNLSYPLFYLDYCITYAEINKIVFLYKPHTSNVDCGVCKDISIQCD